MVKYAIKDTKSIKKIALELCQNILDDLIKLKDPFYKQQNAVWIIQFTQPN